MLNAFETADLLYLANVHNRYEEPHLSKEINRQPQLFILRLWPEILADDLIEWRGKLHYVQANEIRYFRDWPALIPTLLAMLRQANLPITVPNPYPPADLPPNSEPDSDTLVR